MSKCKIRKSNYLIFKWAIPIVLDTVTNDR